MQERYRDDPWALLVGCILFNMVQGKKAQPIHEEFLRLWPSPWVLRYQSTPGTPDAVRYLLQPLGFQNRRTERILKMTEDFIDLRPDADPWVDVKNLHGIGKYGADSFNIFCRGYLVEDVRDKELRRYITWALSEGSGGVVQEDAGAPAEASRGDAETLQPGRAPGGS